MAFVPFLSSDTIDVFGLTERNRKTIENIFRQFNSVSEVMLFGSRAIGTYKLYSDIDLCIINEDFNSSEYIGLVAAFEDPDLPFFTDMLTFYSLQNEELKTEILEQGKIIYRK